MKGWRTIGLNLAVASFGVLEAADWTGMLGNEKAGWALAAIGISNMVLRTVTTTAVGQRV
jgi:hypothetical protein